MGIEDIALAYDRRAAEYAELAGGIEQMAEADLELIAAWRDATHGALLDAGCGPGHWTGFLHDGTREVRGIDLSARFVAEARRSFPHLAFEVGSLGDLPFDDASFGGILAWYSLIHTPPADLPGMLDELARVLAPGGGILIGFFDGEPGEPFDHAVTTAYFWSVGALSALLEPAGFAVISNEHRIRVRGEPSRRPHASVTAVRR